MGKSYLFLFLFLCFLSLISFSIDRKDWLKVPRSLIERPILAVEKKLYSLKYSADSFLKPLVSCRIAGVKLNALQQDFQKLSVAQNQLSSCLEENEKMKKLLGAPLPPSWKFLSAQVVGVAEQMKLDKGEKEGLRKDMNVVSENILVGKISWVGEHGSLVSLPISPGVKIPVVVKRASGIQGRGLLIGEYGENLVLDKILQEEDVQKGDLVITSGEEGWLTGLLIGNIKEVLQKSAEIYRKAQVLPLINYHDLRIVFVVIR